jgi:hypothetical protein
MTLVAEWKTAWRWFSVQSMAASAVVLGAWDSVPDELRHALPRWLPHGVAIALLVLGVAGRLVKQKGQR